MKKQKEKSLKKTKYTALVGRLLFAGATLALVAVLILWDMGYVDIPFLVRIDRREPVTQEPTAEEETVEVEKTDFSALAKGVLNRLFKAEMVEGFESAITVQGYEKGYTSLVKSALYGEYELCANGFLAEKSGTILRASDLYRIPESEGYLLTKKINADGKAVFQGREDGKYYIFNDTSLAFEETVFDPAKPVFYGKGQENTQMVEENGLFGYKGSYQEGRRWKNFTVPASFAIAFPFSENYAVAADESGKISVFDYHGNQVFGAYNLILPDLTREDAESFCYFNNGILRVIFAQYDENGKIIGTQESMINAKGEEVSPPAGYSLVSYREGFMILEKEGKKGFLSYNGEWITTPTYLQCEPYYEGLAVVQGENGKFGLLDTKGDEVLPCCFDRIDSLSGGHCLVYSENTGYYLLSKVKGIYPKDESLAPDATTEAQTKVTITRGPQNTFEHEEDIIIETPIIPDKTTREPHKEYWQ